MHNNALFFNIYKIANVQYTESDCISVTTMNRKIYFLMSNGFILCRAVSCEKLVLASYD